MATNIRVLKIRLYGRLVANGRRTLAEVPEDLRDDVKAWVIENYGEKSLH